MFNILEVHGGGWGVGGVATGLNLRHAVHFYRIYEQHSWQPYNLTPKYIEDAAYNFFIYASILVDRKRKCKMLQDRNVCYDDRNERK